MNLHAPLGTYAVFAAVCGVLTLAGCNRDSLEGKQATSTSAEATTSPEQSAPSATALQGAEFRKLMARMQQTTKEMRRRVERSLSVEHPSKVLAYLAGELPLRGYPNEFRPLLHDLKQKAAALTTSKEPRKAYDALLESCADCHREHADRSMPRIDTLRLDTPAR